MDLFARIFFDTNLLFRGGWPSTDSVLEELFRLVHQLDASILIPEVVEQGIEGVWIRQLYKIHNDDTVTRQSKGIVRSEVFDPERWEIVLV